VNPKDSIQNYNRGRSLQSHNLSVFFLALASPTNNINQIDPKFLITLQIIHHQCTKDRSSSLLALILTFMRPAFAYVNARRKMPLKIHFIYLGNKEIY
jgi:hypothetical protein